MLNILFSSENLDFAQVSVELLQDYLVLVNDFEGVGRFIGRGDKLTSPEKELQWIREKQEEKAALYSLMERKSGDFIGNIELMDLTDTEAELGIAITAAKQEMGYGTEAVRRILDYGFRELGLKRIFLKTDPGNTRAIHVYEKCGFRAYNRSEAHVYMELDRRKNADISLRELTAEDIPALMPLYLDWYNGHEGGCWTEETAAKRIRQVLTIQDAYGLLLEEAGQPIGFAMGYFKPYDDLTGYTLEEIVIAGDRQGAGLGSRLLGELEARVKARGAACVELQAVADEMHEHYYGKAGYRNAKNFVMKVKWLT